MAARSTSKQWGRRLGTPIEPVPKAVESIRAKDRWTVTSTIDVPILELDQSLRFADVLLSRRTRRVCEPMDLHDVLSLIQFLVDSRQVGSGQNLGRLRKISISAGAIHPVEVLVVAGPGVSEPILYCDSHNTAFIFGNNLWFLGYRGLGYGLVVRGTGYSKVLAGNKWRRLLRGARSSSRNRRD